MNLPFCQPLTGTCMPNQNFQLFKIRHNLYIWLCTIHPESTLLDLIGHNPSRKYYGAHVIIFWDGPADIYAPVWLWGRPLLRLASGLWNLKTYTQTSSNKFVRIFFFFSLYQPITSSHSVYHTPSTAFRHLLPKSARFGYTTEGALFISMQLSTDAVSTLWKVWVLIRL